MFLVRTQVRCVEHSGTQALRSMCGVCKALRNPPRIVRIAAWERECFQQVRSPFEQPISHGVAPRWGVLPRPPRRLLFFPTRIRQPPCCERGPEPVEELGKVGVKACQNRTWVPRRYVESDREAIGSADSVSAAVGTGKLRTPRAGCRPGGRPCARWWPRTRDPCRSAWSPGRRRTGPSSGPDRRSGPRSPAGSAS